MSLDRFEIISTIYNTLQDSLKLVKRKEDGKLYTIKTVVINENSEKEKELFFNELRILVPLTHINIISYKEAFYDKKTKSLNMVIEYVDGGDLSMRIKLAKQKNMYFKEKIIWRIFLQILDGINYLHNKYIIHRDLKTSNIYLTKKGSVKIGGLNVGKSIEDIGMALTQIGTPYFTAPEIWKQMPYDYKCDIWSLGCILYEMTTLHVPFLGLNMQELYYNILNLKYKPIPNIYSKELNEIINLILNKNPDNRPSSIELLNNKIILKKIEEFNIKNDNKDESSYINNTIQKIIDDYNKKIKKFDKSEIIFIKNEQFNDKDISSKEENNHKKNIINSQLEQKVKNNCINFPKFKRINIGKNNIKENIHEKDNEDYNTFSNNKYSESAFNQKIYSSLLNNSTGKIKDIIKNIDIFSLDNNTNNNIKNYHKLNLITNPISNQKKSNYILNSNNGISINPTKGIKMNNHNINKTNSLNKILDNKQNLTKKILINQKMNINNNCPNGKLLLNNRKVFNYYKINYKTNKKDDLIINKNVSPVHKNKFHIFKRIFTSNTNKINNKSVNKFDDNYKNKIVNSVNKYQNNIIKYYNPNRSQTFNNNNKIISLNYLGKNNIIKRKEKIIQDGINTSRRSPTNQSKTNYFFIKNSNNINNIMNNQNSENKAKERNKINYINSKLKSQNNKINNYFNRIKNIDIDSKNYNFKNSKSPMLKRSINSFIEYNKKIDMNNEIKSSKKFPNYTYTLY